MIDDLFEEDENFIDSESVKPFFTVSKNKEDKLKWLNQVKDSLLYNAEHRTQQQRLFLKAYRGLSTDNYNSRKDYNTDKRFQKTNKFIINHIHDLTETKVSQMTRLKPAVEVLPANDEYEDKASAKVVSYLIKHIFYQNNLDYMMQQMHRNCRIMGESFLFITWNKDLGDLDPTYVEAKNAGLDKIQLEDGSTIDLRTPIHIGDVEYKIELPWRVFLQRTTSFDKCEYLFRVSTKATEELKKDYPGKASKIMEEEDVKMFDVESLQDRFLENQTVVWEFWHVKNKYNPEGAYVKFTKDVILEDTSLPYSHGKLPVLRLTDLDVPNVLNGVSRYETILPIQRMYDNINTLMVKNIYLTAHAKWMMPRGAAKIEQLGNDNTIVQYQGNQPPMLVQANPNPPEVYSYRESLKQEMQTVYGSQGIARGEVPKGITAASALQFLNEIENERNSTDISKHAFLVKDLAKMTISVCGDNYRMDDGRMIRIVGKNNSTLVKYFDSANLSKAYDIRFDNSTGLPETKAAKIQRIMDTMQRNPNLFSPERWEELLDLGDTDRMQRLAVESLKSADSENEDLLAGNFVGDPEDWEDHIAHWDSHVKAMQSRSFKEEAPLEIKEKFKEHVYITEELMMEKAANSPLFQAQLAQLKLFPIFYHTNFTTPLSAEHQEAMVQGQSNRGEPVSGVIPGQDMEQQNLELKK